MRWSRIGCAALVVAASAALACGPEPLPEPRSRLRSSPLDFSFAGVEGAPISAGSLRGRVTVLLFATTFDLPSQAEAKRLEDLFRTYAPRINAVLVIMEAPKYVELVRSYRDVLGLSYPVAMADSETMRGNSALGDVRAVPTWVIVDREGRLRFRGSGQLKPDELVRLVKKAD